MSTRIGHIHCPPTLLPKTPPNKNRGILKISSKILPQLPKRLEPPQPKRYSHAINHPRPGILAIGLEPIRQRCVAQTADPHVNKCLWNVTHRHTMKNHHPDKQLIVGCKPKIVSKQPVFLIALASQVNRRMRGHPSPSKLRQLIILGNPPSNRLARVLAVDVIEISISPHSTGIL